MMDLIAVIDRIEVIDLNDVIDLFDVMWSIGPTTPYNGVNLCDILGLLL